MVAAAAFLVLLDAAIISATPDRTRVAFALVVSLIVGYTILRIWRSNSKLEKSSVDVQKSPSGGSKTAGEGSDGTRRGRR